MNNIWQSFVTWQNINSRWICWFYIQVHSLWMMAQWLKSTRNTKFFLNHAIDPHFHPFQILFHAAHSLLNGLIDAVSCKCFLPYVTKYRQGPSYKCRICIPYRFWYKVIIILIIMIITFSEVPLSHICWLKHVRKVDVAWGKTSINNQSAKVR